MADDKKKPVPKQFNPLHNKSMDKILEEYAGFHSEKSLKQNEKFVGHRRDNLYFGIVKHLEQHGKDPATGLFNHYGYADFDNKKQWTEDLLHKVLTPSIADHYGPDAAKAYASNHEMFRQYVEQFMGRGEYTYDQIVELLSEKENLKEGFYKDEQVSALFENYLRATSPVVRSVGMYAQHIKHHAKYDDVLKFADKRLGVHKFKHKAGVGVETLLDSIAKIANPKFKPEKSKVYEPLPEKKK